MHNKKYKEDKDTDNECINLLKKYLHDIRNMKPLNNEMLHNIRNMSNDNKMDIIITLSNVVQSLQDLID